ncbi:MAG TPA: hypothetical protein VFW87_17940, partial [Pirellulales bacterium]|nr:hypothetical protein [Pirellulales bacterium]
RGVEAAITGRGRWNAVIAHAVYYTRSRAPANHHQPIFFCFFTQPARDRPAYPSTRGASSGLAKLLNQLF